MEIDDDKVDGAMLTLLRLTLHDSSERGLARLGHARPAVKRHREVTPRATPRSARSAASFVKETRPSSRSWTLSIYRNLGEVEVAGELATRFSRG